MTKPLGGPYRYVPYSPTVHVPDGEFLYDGEGPHDFPFEDGISGELAIEISALTPLFVGHRQTENEDGSKQKHWLVLDGKRTIQGSSVKGAIRNVVEIATLGKFADRIEDRRMSIRDLNNRAEYVDELNDNYRPLSQAGWLSATEYEWSLTPCHWSLVPQKMIEKAFDLKDHTLGDRQSASDKYQRLGFDRRHVQFDPLPISKEGPYSKGRELSRVANLGRGDTEGTLVLTGQPNKRNANDKNKSSDFIFWDPLGEEPSPLTIPRDVQRDFEAIHREATGERNQEWDFWYRKALQGHEIPVFWLPNPDGTIRAMGFAMMFRLPYNLTLREAVRQTGLGDGSQHDMADLIFGQIIDASEGHQEARANKGHSLKGRAAFSHFTQSNQTGSTRVEEVLLAPKHGFYPANIVQLEHSSANPPKTGQTINPNRRDGRPTNHWTTLQNPKANLRGHKRYMASLGTRRSPDTSNVGGKTGPKQDNRKILTRFDPVGKGATFRGKLRFFNLRPWELGALIWAIHWGGEPDNPLEPRKDHAHMLGAAKPLGYGASTIQILTEYSNIAIADREYRRVSGDAAKPTLESALRAFIEHMTRHNPDWAESEQITQLLATADMEIGERLRKDGLLDPPNGPKPFVRAKQDGLILPLPDGGIDRRSTHVPVRTEGTGGSRHAHGNRENQRSGGGPPRAETPNWRKGDIAFHREEGFEVELMETPAPGAKSVRVDFGGGDIEEVAISLLTRK